MRARKNAAAAALALSVLLAPGSVRAEGLFTAEGGVGTTVVRDRVRDHTTNQAALFLSPSWRWEDADLAFDLVLRWETEGWKFVAQDWERPGDILRILRRASYRPGGAGWSAGLEVLKGIGDLGPGLVLRDPVGAVEVGYIVPGFTARAEGKTLRAEGFVDRLLEPTLAGVRGDWTPGERFHVSFEGASDPAAPAAWTGGTSRDRPRADAEDAVWGAGGEASYSIYKGEWTEIYLTADGATISSGSSGGAAAGGGGGVRLSFSPYYNNRLEFSARSLAAVDGFIPAYFDAPYQVERWGLPGLAPLASYLSGKEGTSSRFNLFSLDYRLGSMFSVAGDFSHEAGGTAESARLVLRLAEAGERGMEMVMWSRALAPSDRLFDDERLFTRVSAIYSLSPHTLLRVSYHYGWLFRDGAGGAVGASEWVGGILYSLTL